MKLTGNAATRCSLANLSLVQAPQRVPERQHF
jgi:hypothetical protein